MSKTFTLVILNKNDAPSLDRVLDEIDFSLFDRVLGFDGNSADNSLEIFNAHGIPVMKDIPGGRGGAIRHAISSVDTDFVIFLSSDGEEDPGDLSKLKRTLESGADLVIGSRVGHLGSGFKSKHNLLYLHRKIFLHFISKMIEILFGGEVKDCWNGYRGIAVAKARSIKLTADDFLLEAQMTIRFLKCGFVVREVPTIERKRFFGDSQNPAIASGWGHIVLLFREYLNKDLK